MKPPSNSPADCRGEVLVVDDDDLFLRVCSGVLRKAGLRVETANNPTNALERLQTHRFDAVVSDVCMPEIDGVSLVKALRSVDMSVPVVLMTGMPTLETAISAIDLGVHKLIPKPFDVDAFVLAVRGAVDRRRGADSGHTAHQRLGLAIEGLWLAYQPIVHPETKRVFAYEALVRTHTPGIAGPPELIALAEQTDRVFELGRVIRARAAEDLESLPSDVVLFVNLHPQDLDDPDLHLPGAPLSKCARRVVLEITERSSVAHDTKLVEHVNSLRALGYRVAIDDLGAGYSGLTTLARVQPEFVKLDGSLVRDIHTSGVNQLIVTAVLELARELQSQVVAEAIETQREYEILKHLGVELLQGYYFAKPAPPFARVDTALFTLPPATPRLLIPKTRRPGAPGGSSASPAAAETLPAPEPSVA